MDKLMMKMNQAEGKKEYMLRLTYDGRWSEDGVPQSADFRDLDQLLHEIPIDMWESLGRPKEIIITISSGDEEE